MVQESSSRSTLLWASQSSSILESSQALLRCPSRPARPHLPRPAPELAGLMRSRHPSRGRQASDEALLIIAQPDDHLITADVMFSEESRKCLGTGRPASDGAAILVPQSFLVSRSSSLLFGSSRHHSHEFLQF